MIGRYKTVYPVIMILICSAFILSAACAGGTAQQAGSQTIAVKSDVKIDVISMQTVTPAIYLQMPNLDITFVDFEITNNGDSPVRLSVESEIQGYSEKAINTVDIAPQGKVVIGQTPLLKPQAIPLEIANATLHYRITDSSGAVIEEQTLPVKIYGRDTMLWAVKEGDDWTDTDVFIGAFVTPHAPEIDELVRKAVEYHPSNSMEGYQCSQCSEEQWKEYTTAQVKAVYEALQQDYSLKYVNSTIAFSNESDAPQRVRLPAESINNKSANCIDGTVLYAAALESMDMHPYIVLTPTHAFLCYEINPDDPNNLGCLETTMTGSSSFEDATDVAEQELSEEMANGNMKSGKSQILSVKELRARGILPMK